VKIVPSCCFIAQIKPRRSRSTRRIKTFLCDLRDLFGVYYKENDVEKYQLVFTAKNAENIEDPLGMAAGDSNLYRYCGNNPISRTDPFGLSYEEECTGGGAPCCPGGGGGENPGGNNPGGGVNDPIPEQPIGPWPKNYC